MAETLDYFLPNILTQDTRKRLQLHEDILTYLHSPGASSSCDDMDKFIDGISAWISGSNYKISLNGLEVVSCLIDLMESGFQPYISVLLPLIIDRLADNKDQVRASAQDVLLKMMISGSSPQFVFERATFAFSHKSPKVKEEILKSIHRVLNELGSAKNIGLSKLVPHIVKLLEDQNIPIRDLAVETLVVIYQYVGEKLRVDLAKKDISPNKMAQLFARLDEVKNSGCVVGNDAGKGEDESDGASCYGSSSVNSKKSNLPNLSSTGAKSTKQMNTSSSAVSSPLGVDEDIFTKQFNQVPKINIFSSKEFNDRITKLRENLSDPNLDWSKRVDALKEIRACFYAGIQNNPDFSQLLVTLEPCVQFSVRDLRSQVVREACITIAFMAQELGKEFGHFAESILQSLINLVPNSAKIMATSSTVCIRFILQFSHVPKLIPIITSNLTSKSSVIRKQCCEFLYQILSTWPTHTLERHIAVLQEAIKKGIGDADADARVQARKAFWSFADHFKGQADSLMHSLDAAKQKQLLGEHSGNSASNTSLNNVGRSSTNGNRPGASTRSSSIERTSSGYGRQASGGRRATIDNHDGVSVKPNQSSSAVDLMSLSDNTPGHSGISRADGTRSYHNSSGSLRLGRQSPSVLKHRQPLALSCDEQTLSNAMKTDLVMPDVAQNCLDEQSFLSNRLDDLLLQSTPLKLSTRTSFPLTAQRTRPRKSSFSGASNYSQHATPSAAERSRSRTRVGVSQSQPSSRSNSPAARFSYITPIQPDVVQSVATNRRRSNSGMSKSRESSREGSPNRSYGRERRLSGQSASGGGGSIKHRSRTFGSQRSCPGDDLGSAVSDALHGPKSRGRNENYDSDDAASETSSICSDGSSYWASGRQLTEDMSEIIACMCSGSWSDRRDGLLALTSLLANNKTLSRSELKKVTDIFTRMFHDPHGKVFSVFLDSLVQLVLVHHNDMSDWLYVLLTRLLTKTGADMLGSVHAKVQRALDVVRGSFPTGQQFALLSRFLIDQTQSPNLKVKVSMLSYFHGLIQLMVPTDFINSSDIRLAISRIITWTTEPKSVDVRKAAQAVLLALHNLNTSEFDVMMSVLPKTFQEGAERILQNRLRPSGQASESSSPRNSISPITTCNSSNRAPPLGLYSMKTEPLNSEDIYNSIKRTSDDIHNLVKCEPQVENHRRRSNSGSKSDSPVCAVSLASGRMLPTSLAIESRIPSFLQNLPNSQEFAKSLAGVQRGVRDENLQNRISYNQIKMEKNHIRDDCLFNEDLPTESTSDQLQDILIELSNHNEREEERKSALLNLMKKAREESIAVWDEYFNAVLLMLLETLGDGDGHIRALALRVLAEFLRCQPERFREYVELTIVRSLEAHKDPVKEVTRAAEECISLLARVVAPDRCHVVLRPLIECEDFPVNLAAVKMLTQVIEDVDSETVSIMMPDIVPSLLKGYENYQSSVRKASVVCLVAIYMSVGEEIRPFLQDLHGSKVKLLNVYIKRALEQQGTSSCATSKTSSPTSVIET